MSEIKHRAIILNGSSLIVNESESFNKNNQIFRKDIKFNGHNNINRDIFEALKDMEKAGIIDCEKIFKMFKMEKGLNIIDAIDILTCNDDSWMNLK